ncbi:MAG: 6-phosphofructokinase [Candidatus Omnitrophica bacterium]|nr:6-phosphofructokinase [Candidatus Omnitrophota bacterium]
MKKKTKKPKKVAVLTSGGDAPGMNAAIRSVVRCAIYNDLEVFGVRYGYEGLIDGDFIKMNARSVSNILSKGGTMLKTARSERFMKKSGRGKAYSSLKRYAIDSLVVIGGNGSFKGAHKFSIEHKNIQVIGIPGTIDNDVAGTDYTIGASTAVNTALSAIDKIRDTVSSMERIYVVEVMGRVEPFIAISVGLAGGAEDVLFPSSRYKIEDMYDDIRKGREKGKVSWIVIVSEGVAKASEISDLISKNTGYMARSVVLGYVQRGGSPDAYDRILASRMGAHAIEAVLKGESDKMVGIESHSVRLVTFDHACKRTKDKLNMEKKLYELTKVLAI